MNATPDTGHPRWLEDPELAAVVAEVEEFVGIGGWDAKPRLFALVPTDEVRRTQPELAAHLVGSGRYTPIAQDDFSEGDLALALGRIGWPDAVVGCVLAQEIVVLPPDVGDELAADPETAAGRAAGHPARTEARLVAGVLRDAPGGACLLRVRPSVGTATAAGGDQAAGAEPLRGGDLAPGLIAALLATFD